LPVPVDAYRSTANIFAGSGADLLFSEGQLAVQGGSGRGATGSDGRGSRPQRLIVVAGARAGAADLGARAVKDPTPTGSSLTSATGQKATSE
jgi:hypothetical protein